MWREAAEAIARAARDLEPYSKIYVVGGAAENRLTILSDVDVVICLERDVRPDNAWELRRRVIAIAIDKYGLPWDYPAEIHVIDCKTFERVFHGRRVVEVL